MVRWCNSSSSFATMAGSDPRPTDKVAPNANLKRMGDKVVRLQRMGLWGDVDAHGLKDRIPQQTHKIIWMSLRHQLEHIVHPSMFIVVAGSCAGTALMLYGFDADSEEDIE